MHLIMNEIILCYVKLSNMHVCDFIMDPQERGSEQGEVFRVAMGLKEGQNVAGGQ